MRIGGRRHGVGRRWRPALHRRTAAVVAAVLALTVAAPQQSLARPGQDPLPLSWLWSWFDLPAGGAAPPPPPPPAPGAPGAAAGTSPPAPSPPPPGGRGGRGGAATGGGPPR